MFNDLQFYWVEFYKELADVLLQFKNNRQELIEKVYQIFERTGMNIPTLERDNQLIDIDPFTFPNCLKFKHQFHLHLTVFRY